MLVFLLHVNSTKRYLGFTVVGFISDISSCVTCLRNTFIIRRTTKTWTYFVITIVNLGKIIYSNFNRKSIHHNSITFTFSYNCAAALLLFVRPMILFCQLIFLQRQKVQQEQDWMLMLASMVAVINAVQTVYLIILTVGECTSGTPLQKLSAKSHELMLPIHSVHSSRS